MPQKQHQSSYIISNVYNQIIIWGGGTGMASKILVWTESIKHPECGYDEKRPAGSHNKKHKWAPAADHQLHNNMNVISSFLLLIYCIVLLLTLS